MGVPIWLPVPNSNTTANRAVQVTVGLSAALTNHPVDFSPLSYATSVTVVSMTALNVPRARINGVAEGLLTLASGDVRDNIVIESLHVTVAGGGSPGDNMVLEFEGC